jgi:hypothetical protein
VIDTAIDKKIDRILQSLDQQIRGTEQTSANLKRLLDSLDHPTREKCLDHLFKLLVNRIRSKSGSDQTTRIMQQQSIGILFKMLFEYGRVVITLCKILGFLDVDSSDVTNNWRDVVSQEIVSAVYSYSNVLRQNTLDVLKDHVALFYDRANDLARAMPAFLPYVSNLKRAIDSAEFSRFEQQLRGPQVPETVVDTESGQLGADALNPSIGAAMKEAADYLRGKGVFNPKIAADLMRTSIDESHRALVNRLVALTNTQCADLNKDGSRRTYLRKIGFITEPEERFFSAIYTLLSEEASHKLIAARETMLVLQQTVHNYILLLNQRLLNFLPERDTTTP